MPLDLELFIFVRMCHNFSTMHVKQRFIYFIHNVVPLPKSPPPLKTKQNIQITILFTELHA